MRKLTPLGQAVKILCVESNLQLNELSSRIGCSALFLTRVLYGDRVFSLATIERLIAFFQLEAAEAEKIRTLAFKQVNIVHIDVAKRSDRAKELAVVFADRLGNMTDEQIETMLTDLKRSYPK